MAARPMEITGVGLALSPARPGRFILALGPAPRAYAIGDKAE